TPHVFPIISPTAWIGNSISTVGQGGTAGVLEIIEPFSAHIGVLDTAKVDPDVRVLMSKKGWKDDECLVIVSLPGIGTRPGCPGIRTNGKGRRAESKQIEDHRFIVATPIIGEKPRLRRPAVAHLCQAHLHPRPLDAAIEVVGQGSDLGFGDVRLIEILLHVEHSAQQQRSIDRGQLRILHASPGLHVEKMVIETLVARGVGLGTLRNVPEKCQGGQRTISPYLPANPPAVNAHGESRQPEPYSSDARY